MNFVPCGLQAAGGDVHVLRRDQLHDVRDDEVVHGHAVAVELQADLRLQRPQHLDLQHAGKGLDRVLHVVGDLLELHGRDVAGDADLHDRELGEVDLLDRGILHVLGQVAFGQVHAVADALQGHIGRHVRHELHVDHREALGAGGVDLLDAANAVELLLDLHRDGRFDVRRRDAFIDGVDQNVRDRNIRERIPRQGQIAIDAQDDDDQPQDGDRRSVLDGDIGE